MRRRPPAGQTGAAAMLCAAVLAMLVGLAGVALAGFALGADAAAAAAEADAVAHDVELEVAGLPPWVRDDLSLRVQADPGRCAVRLTDGDAGVIDDLCLVVTRHELDRVHRTGDPSEVLLLVALVPNQADEAAGRGDVRLDALVEVARRRRLPWCRAAPVPSTESVSGACWALSTASAHAAA